MTAQWRVETRTRAGVSVAQLPWSNLQFEKLFNKPSGIRCTLPLYHPVVQQSLITPGLHELCVRRNESIVACGPLWDVVASTDQKTLTLAGASLEDYLDTRVVKDATYTAVDQTAIAWGLINASQGASGGALGITSGTLGTGVTRSASYLTRDGKYVLEAIQDLSEMDDGPDFWIDPATRAFNAIYPRPSTNRGLTLSYPNTISSYSIQYYGKYMRNQVVVSGPEPYSVTANDPSSISTYGLRELADSYTDAPNTNALSAYASRLRDLRAVVKNYPTVVLRTQDINVFDPNIIQFGDQIKLIISDGYVDINALHRYGGCQITVANSGAETIVLYMQDLRELG